MPSSRKPAVSSKTSISTSPPKILNCLPTPGDRLEMIHSAAAKAEDSFVAHVKELYPDALDEKQQKEMILAAGRRLYATPDIKFAHPVCFAGIPGCNWVEFKNFYGTRDHEHFDKQEVQYRKYLRAFGRGVVVYSRGCDFGLMSHLGEDVHCFGESEVRWWIGSEIARLSQPQCWQFGAWPGQHYSPDVQYTLGWQSVPVMPWAPGMQYTIY